MYHVVISKGACRSCEVIIQLCSLQPDFPSNVLFLASSCEVCIKTPARFPHYSIPLGNLLLAWHGKGGR